MNDKLLIHLKPGRFYLLASAAGFVLLTAVVISWLWLHLTIPYREYASESILIEISSGRSLRGIGEDLERLGIIRSAELFWLYGKATGRTTSLKAGEYRFDQPLSLIDVFHKLEGGDIYYHRVTVPEGLDIVETAAVFVEAGFGSEEEFKAAARLVELIADFDSEALNLEGYLFPDTYFLTGGTSAVEIIQRMVTRFNRSWTEDFDRRAEELGMSPRQVVTLASMIEKEAALREERRLVSAVFHNRLVRNMRLACDPTVIYAVKQVKEYDGVINQSDLELDSPYNTYLYPGLPPGPIASPGEESISAALNPAEASYLYFVSRNDGSHVFSETYAEHSRAVRQYQR